MSHHLLAQADARRIPLQDGSVHCVVTSVPYWNLRDYQVDGQIGLEESPAAYVRQIVGAFREVKRVLRDDSVAWLNIGDSFAGSWGNQGRKEDRGTQRPINGPMIQNLEPYPMKTSGTGTIPEGSGLKPKDLVGIPWRVALALQADGWYLRSEIIWAKPNPMPESVTDRPTKSHEQIFLLAKGERYFYDADAIREPSSPTNDRGNRKAFRGLGAYTSGNSFKNSSIKMNAVPGCTGEAIGRNRRSVWTVPTTPFPGAHFATFPPKLIEPCIKAGTSEHGVCPKCGGPWERETERTGGTATTYAERGKRRPSGQYPGTDDKWEYNGVGTVGGATIRTTGWRPTCACNAGPPVPAVVLDPFSGASTTGVVALALGRSYIGLDLSRDYLTMSQRRIERPHAPVERPSVSSGEVHSLFTWIEGGTT